MTSEGIYVILGTALAGYQFYLATIIFKVVKGKFGNQLRRELLTEDALYLPQYHIPLCVIIAATSILYGGYWLAFTVFIHACIMRPCLSRVVRRVLV